MNELQYHGGTNFGRTTSAFTTTRYYDEAPLDEYGMERQPKWSHLRDAHKALLLCRKAILGGVPTVQKLNDYHEVHIIIIVKLYMQHACISIMITLRNI